MLPTPLATTRRLLLLSLLVVLVVPFEAAPEDLTAPPSLSCLDAAGESYLQSLLDRIHELETQLNAEQRSRLSERSEAESNLRSVTDALTQQAAATLDPSRTPTAVEDSDAERVKGELAALRAQLDQATAARLDAEREAAAASKAASTFASALKEVERRLEEAEKRNALTATTAPPSSAPPSPEPSPSAQIIEPSPARRQVSIPQGEPEAAPLAAPSGTAAGHVTQPSRPAVARSTDAPTSERERAAAQLAALIGRASPAAEPQPSPQAADAVNPAPTAPLASVEPQTMRARCDEPADIARIAPGDRLAIHVDHLEEVSDTFEVESDGRIHLPLVGTVPAAGRNQNEIATDLTQRLAVYLQQPRVDVALKRGCE